MLPEQIAQGCRACTVAARAKAVERVILTMKERLAEPLSLPEMAEIAVSSPYHFNRFFRHITGIPPCLFLSALRLEAAKRLLLTTDLNIIDICFEVGYDSLGTFTTRFTQMVGLPPTSFRRMAEGLNLAEIFSQYQSVADYLPPNSDRRGVKGRVTLAEDFDGLVFVGLFPLLIPQSGPVSCALLTGPGEYHLAPAPDGQFSVLAAALDKTDDPYAALLAENARRGRAGPLTIRDGGTSGPTDLRLHRPRLTDPPITIALPFLLAQRLGDRHSVAI
ncbi:MAG TPA: helix-turn-helix transcriptional regulator [Pyrinomonadaceae bacterium]|nr:helix-turn-helix transcriptional regulator [Pyrinomonadaceae bacterium]